MGIILAIEVLLGLGMLIYWMMQKARCEKRGGKEKGYRVDFDDVGGWFTAQIIIALVAIVILAPWGVVNRIGLAEWEVFYQANVANYQATVDNTKAILSTDSLGGAVIDGSVEKWAQGQAVSDRIRELRDSVNHYNTTLASMRYMHDNWIIAGWPIVPHIPDYMKPISLR